MYDLYARSCQSAAAAAALTHPDGIGMAACQDVLDERDEIIAGLTACLDALLPGEGEEQNMAVSGATID